LGSRLRSTTSFSIDWGIKWRCRHH